jgi:phosphate transport system permease protein
MSTSNVPGTPTPQRYTTSRATILVDRGMTWFIISGGLAVIVAVFGIFVFILWQVLPLFSSADVNQTAAIELPAEIKATDVTGVLSDEWGEMPLLVERDGTATFIPLPPRIDAHAHGPATKHDAAAAATPRAPQIIDLKLGEKPVITASEIDHRRQRVIIGTADGRLAVRSVKYDSAFTEGGGRLVRGTIGNDLTLTLGEEGKPVISAGYGDSGTRKIAAIIQQLDGDKRTVLAATLTQTRSLLGAGEVKKDRTYDLSSQIAGVPEQLLVDERAESIVVVTKAGDLLYFFLDGEGEAFTLRQSLRPFADQPEPHIASVDYLLGEVSLVVTNDTGINRIFSLYIKPGESQRTFGQTKEFSKLPGGAHSYAPSVRNKAFLVTHGKTASLRYGTSEAIRWEDDLDYPIVASAISGKYHRIIMVGEDAKVHTYDLDDPHPESGLTAMFGRVWYEGSDRPKHDWQSTGSTDDFEPKLSMIPLLVGSLKGTIYALLFALPIAILGAIYTAEFMHPKFKKVVKPVVEIMASLPSVVLGFLAAIWLAPIMVDRVPSLIMVVIGLPTMAIVFGWVWAGLPMSTRQHIKPGYEFLAFIPMLVVTAWVAWSLGPVLESLVFRVNGTGDFPNWWRSVTGLSYEQRNSLVVGIMMGFAVIPIIFTIAEDALSNVPPALRSGSLALGASRWQTAMRVVLPTASAGIFSAVMIGFGRAIGETMIVVMATGNTPIMSMNMFDGMRTLSANIAVEIPEAPHNSTLYRTLFLGALLLFMLTFVVNTVAELMRQHLREKYKTV